MPLVKITTVYSRWARYCLHFEWVALPAGAGMSVAMPTNLIPVLMGQRHGALEVISIFFSVIGPILLTVGFWRPMHRRFGLERNSLWLGSENYDTRRTHELVQAARP